MPSEFYLQGKGIKKTPTQPTEQTVATPTTATPTPTTPTERGGSSFYKQGKTQLAQIAQPAPQQPQKGFLEKAGDTLKGIGEFAYEAGRGLVGRAATMLGQEVGTVEDISTSVTQGKPLKSSAKVQLENLQTELQTGKKIERNVVEKAGQEIYNFEAPVFGSLRDIVEGIGSILPEGTPIQEQLRAKKERLNEELKIYEDNAKFTNDFTLVNRTKAQLQGIDSEIAFWDEEKKRKETGQISQITENLFANSPNLTDEERKQKAEEVKKLEEILKRKEQDDKDLLTVEGKLKKYGLDTVKDANQQRKQLKEKYGNPDFWTPQGFLFAAAEQATDIVEGLGTAIAAGYLLKKGKIKSAKTLLGISLATNYAQEFGSAYTDAILEGATEEQAIKAGRIYGVTSVAISKIGLAEKLSDFKINSKNIDNITNSFTQKLKQSAIRRSKAGVGEALEENLQDIAATTISQIYKENPEWFQGVTETTVLSFFFGALLSGGSKFDEKDGVTINDEKKANAVIDDSLKTPPAKRTEEQNALVEAHKIRVAEKESKRATITQEPIRDIFIDDENVSDRVREAFAPATTPTQPITPAETPAVTPTVTPTPTPTIKPEVTPTPTKQVKQKAVKEVKPKKTLGEKKVKAPKEIKLPDLVKKAELLKQKYQKTKSGDDLRSWKRLQNQIDQLQQEKIETNRKIREEYQTKTDLELRKKDKTVDKIDKKDLDILVAEAKNYKNFDEFKGKVRGSSTQYGAYTPKVRKFVNPESVFLGDMKGLNPESKITVYRGLDVKNVGNKKIKNGDFVTTDYNDALQYTDSPSKVISLTTKLKNLVAEYPSEVDLTDPSNPVSYELIYNDTGKINKITDTKIKEIWDEVKGITKPKKTLGEKKVKAPKILEQITEAPKKEKLKKGQINLTEEARKYKTADEFVKAQEKNILYHGTTYGNKINKFSLDRVNFGVGANVLAQGNKGIYLTESKPVAKFFSRKANEFSSFKKDPDIEKDLADPYEVMYSENANTYENVLEVVLSSDIRIKELNKYPNIDEIEEIIKSGNYDAVKFPEIPFENFELMLSVPKDLKNNFPKETPKTTFVFNLDKIKTKEQLNDIWKQAQKEKPKTKPEVTPIEAPKKTIKQEKKVEKKPAEKKVASKLKRQTKKQSLEEALKQRISGRTIKFRSENASDYFPPDNLRLTRILNDTLSKQKLSDRYSDIVKIANNIPNDPQISRILMRLDALTVAIANTKITDSQIIQKADKLINDYNEYKYKQIKKYLSNRNPKFREEGIIQFDKNLNRLTSAFLELKDIKSAETLTKKNLLFLLNKYRGSGIKKFEANAINEIINTEYANEDRISVAEFRQKLLTQFLPLEYGTTDRYANYGADSIDMLDTTKNTYLLNSPFNHGKEGHFAGDFPLRKLYGKSESEKGYDTQGLFSHFRTFDEKFDNISHVVEIQSDAFQKDVGTQPQIDSLTKEIKNAGITRENNKALFENLKNDYENFIDENPIFTGVRNDSQLSTASEKFFSFVLTNDKEIKKYLKNKNLEISSNADENKTKAEKTFRNDVSKLYNMISELTLYERNVLISENRYNLLNTRLGNLLEKPISEEEKRFMAYQNNWHERTIREILKIKADEGIEKVRFATPETVAKVEGFWSGDDDERMPYEVISGNEDRLEQGDTIDYGGDTYVVIYATNDGINVAKEDEVTIFDYSEAADEEAENRYNDDITNNLKSIENEIGQIKQVKDIKKFDEVADAISKYKNYLNKEKNADMNQYQLNAYKAEQEDALSKQRSSLNNYIKPNLERLNNIKTLDDFKELDIAARENYSWSELYFYRDNIRAIDENLDERYRNLPEYQTALKNFYEDKTKLNQILTLLKNKFTNELEGRQRKYDADYAWFEDRVKEKEKYIQTIKDLPKPSEEILNKIPERLRTAMEENPTYYTVYTDESNLIDLLDNIKGNTDDWETSEELIDWEGDVKEKFKENYLENFDGFDDWYQTLYSDDYGNTLYGTNGNVITLNQPDGYTDRSEEFDIEEFDGGQRAVLDFYDKRVIPYVQNLRKGNIELVTDDSGNTWYETNITEEDKNRFLAFRVMDDMARIGFNIDEKQEKQILNLNKKIYGDSNVKFIQNIFANKDAVGAYLDNMIFIFEGKASPTDTYLHEAVHKYIDIFMSMDEQVKLFDAAIGKYKITDLATLEEKIAEDFIRFANARFNKQKTFLGKIQVFFEDLINRTNLFIKNKDAIDTLYNNIISGKAKQIKKQREEVKKKKVTKLGEKKAAQAPPEKKRLGQKKKMPEVVTPATPVGQGKVKKSRFMERLTEELLDTNPEAFGFDDNDGTYNVANLDRESEKAINFIEADPIRALKVALGAEAVPAGYLENSISVAVALRLRQLGNIDLYKQVVTRNTLQNTRRGQEIVSLRGHFNNNSPENYIKQALNARITKLGAKFGSALGTRLSLVGNANAIKENKKKVVERIQKEKVELKKLIKDKRIKSAQEVIDSLRC